MLIHGQSAKADVGEYFVTPKRRRIGCFLIEGRCDSECTTHGLVHFGRSFSSKTLEVDGGEKESGEGVEMY